jgi:hypothetical protein
MPRRPPPRTSRVQDRHRNPRPVRVLDDLSRLKPGVRIHDGGHGHVLRVDDTLRRNGELWVELSNPVTEEKMGEFPVGPISSSEGGAGEWFYVDKAWAAA